MCVSSVVFVSVLGHAKGYYRAQTINKFYSVRIISSFVFKSRAIPFAFVSLDLNHYNSPMHPTQAMKCLLVISDMLRVIESLSTTIDDRWLYSSSPTFRIDSQERHHVTDAAPPTGRVCMMSVR